MIFTPDENLIKTFLLLYREFAGIKNKKTLPERYLIFENIDTHHLLSLRLNVNIFWYACQTMGLRSIPWHETHETLDMVHNIHTVTKSLHSIFKTLKNMACADMKDHI